MKRFLAIFVRQDCGQDLIEYTLLVAFVALTTAGLFLSNGASIDQVWSSANSVLAIGAGPQSPSSDGGGGNGRH
jgi:Flp pilus assembly pilin Flp